MTGAEIAVVCGVGFGAALLGALAGHVGTLRIEKRREFHQRQGVVAALLAEAREINARAIMVIDKHNAYWLSVPTAAWEELRVSLGEFIPFELYQEMWGHYSQAPVIRKAMDDFWRNPQLASEAERTIRQWVSDLNLIMNKLTLLPEAKRVKADWEATRKPYQMPAREHPNTVKLP